MQVLCELCRNQGVSVLPSAKSELDALVTGRHQGAVAVLASTLGGEARGVMREADLTEHLSQVAAPLILILDGVTDPHNLGACLRSADAAGAYDPPSCHAQHRTGAPARARAPALANQGLLRTPMI